MIDELPAAPDPVTDTPTVFSQKAAAFVLAQKAMVPQINVTAANMNSAANGGAFSIPYKFLTSTLNNGSAAGGIISFYPTQILVDVKSSAGALVTNALAAAGAGTSAIKSYLRITNATDPSKWATYSVSSYALSAGGLYGVFNVTLIDRTSSTPFANNDAVILSITPNGDKGDQGPTYTNPLLHIREEQPAGQSGAVGTTIATNIYRRVLNSVKSNTISGTNLSGNQITLPAGTYNIRVRAPLVGRNRVSVYDVTGAADLILGGSAPEAGSTGGLVITSWSEGMGRVTLAASKTIEVRTFNSTGQNGWGEAVADSKVQVYTEIWIEKVA